MSERFSITDRRASARPVTPPPASGPSNRLITSNLNAEMRRLREAGMTLPRSNVAARAETANLKASVNNRTLMAEMNRSRLNGLRGRTASLTREASNVQVALPKVRRPLSSLEDKGIPYEIDKPDALQEIRRWARMFYLTHDLVPLLMDIYSKFPVVGLDFKCKDPQLVEFYRQMFLDQLDYENFLQDLGREFWISGEVTSLAHFNETLGVWSAEEILNPDNIHVSRSLFQPGERVQLLVKDMVESLRGGPFGPEDSDLTESEKLERSHEYRQLVEHYPEIIDAARRGDGLDISEALVSRIVNKSSAWDLRGTPHLMRSFKTLMLEESLNAAQDAVADRLYSPLILATLGIQNLDGDPWIPDQVDLDETRDDLQAALAADFRLMVHNFGLDIRSVFGREAVPRFDQDYSRIDRKLMQAWGISESLVSGTNTNTYAGTAVNREFVTQMMSSYQNRVKRHMRHRMEVIAEAQGHYDYETSGGERKVVYREIVDVNADGEEVLRKVPKLLIPEVQFQTINLRDEAQERAFLQTLKNMGVPISDGTLSMNVPIEFEEELEHRSEEQVSKWVAQAQAMKKGLKIIKAQGLPTPPELVQYEIAESQKKIIDEQAESAEANADIQQQRAEIFEETGELPGGGVGAGGGGTGRGTGTGAQPKVQGDPATGGGAAPTPAPRNTGGQNRPAESDEQRAGAPKASHLRFWKDPSSFRTAQRTSVEDAQRALDRRLGGPPRVRELVSSEEFYDALNQNGLDFTEDIDEIEVYHFAGAKGQVDVRIKEAHAQLCDMLEQYEMAYGVQPVWEG